MTDLNALLNLPGFADFFSNNSSCDNLIDGDILTGPVEKTQSGIQNPLPTIDLKDPNAFILLLSHVVEKISNYQEANEVTGELNQSSSEIVNAETEESVEEDSEKQTIHEMENNVAVSWISSQYYQQEIEKNRAPEQEYNPIDLLKCPEQNEEKLLPTTVQIKESQIQADETISRNDALLEEIQQIDALKNMEKDIQESDIQTLEQQPAVVEVRSSLLQDTDLIVNSELPQIITNTLRSPAEPIENSKDFLKNSVPYSKKMELMTSTVHLESKLSDSESLLEEKNTNQTISFQSLVNEKENAVHHLTSTPTLSASVIENTDGAKLQLMGQVVTNEARVDAPMEGRTPILDNVSQTLMIPIEVDKPEWSKQFSDQIIWLGQQDVKSAVIKINPEDLGPLEINIKVTNDIASINIVTHNHHVRDIIDQSLPRLQAMMADQGLNLSEVQIDSDANPRRFSQQNDSTQEQLTQTFEDEIGVTPLKNKGKMKGLVDYFA